MLTLHAAVERLFEFDSSNQPATAECDIDGELPPFPAGTWLLNGPGRFERGGQRYAHWLDGDGLVRAVMFADGRVSFASRFVHTRKSQYGKSISRKGMCSLIAMT